MIIELISLIATGAMAYFWHEKVIKDKLDSPRNNEVVKGLDKPERKEKIKENEAELKKSKEEIKELDKERKELLKDETKKDEAQEKLEEKEEKVKELKELETNLTDLKLVEKNSYWAYVPNKLSWNNGLWVGGTILGLALIFKFCIGVFSWLLGYVFPSSGQN